MTLTWQDSDLLVCVENIRHFEMLEDPSRKGIQTLERVGIEIKIDSMQNDGFRSWIVISRGVN